MEEAIIALRELLTELDNRMNKAQVSIDSYRAQLDAAQSDRLRLKKRRDQIASAVKALGG